MTASATLTNLEPRLAEKTANEVECDLECKLIQLRSLLMSMHGVGADWLETIGKGHRDNLLWIASDLAEEVEVLRVRRQQARANSIGAV